MVGLNGTAVSGVNTSSGAVVSAAAAGRTAPSSNAIASQPVLPWRILTFHALLPRVFVVRGRSGCKPEPGTAHSPINGCYLVFQLAEVAVPCALFAEILRRIGV